MKSLNTEGDVENLGPAETNEVSPGRQTKAWEYFLRALVVVAGVFLGAILALVIGLFTGWIEILC